MISGRSDSIRLTTGFGGFMPSHSLVPVTAPRLGRDTNPFRFASFFLFFPFFIFLLSFSFLSTNSFLFAFLFSLSHFFLLIFSFLLEFSPLFGASLTGWSREEASSPFPHATCVVLNFPSFFLIPLFPFIASSIMWLIVSHTFKCTTWLLPCVTLLGCHVASR